MFGFCGATANRGHQIRADNYTFEDFIAQSIVATPIHEDDFWFRQENLVLTAHISHSSHGCLSILFTSIGGHDVLRLYVNKADAIADLCHTVATQPGCVNAHVQIVLTNGSVLNNMDGMATLDTLLEDMS